ncbi:hypothetical protein H0H81_001728 [Sphagnurus paluster]|uniref:G domain-containing protein n=1 Tax=Sphagnurus paluster TaxID=117069 RepID=A0A9P7FZK2_9AGAR|nr:hypothetical protein H0H81_001728 [Sphagnurus paluster]
MSEKKEIAIKKSTPPPNVILFGESGSGKSSIVNMLAQRPCAQTSSSVKGCTFIANSYPIEILGTTFNIYDTAGLDEGDQGNVPKKEAIVQLLRLLKSLDTGVSLLVFCMRGPRIKESAHRNWRLFHEVICRRKVPIVLAVTGIEQEYDMDEWWIRNKGAFQDYDMFPNGVACITAIRGKPLKDRNRQPLQDSEGRDIYSLDDEYRESMEKTGKAIKTQYRTEPWKVEPVEWFRDIVTVSYKTRCLRAPIEYKETRTVAGAAIQELAKALLISQEEAERMGKALSSDN